MLVMVYHRPQQTSFQFDNNNQIPHTVIIIFIIKSCSMKIFLLRLVSVLPEINIILIDQLQIRNIQSIKKIEKKKKKSTFQSLGLGYDYRYIRSDLPIYVLQQFLITFHIPYGNGQNCNRDLPTVKISIESFTYKKEMLSLRTSLILNNLTCFQA